MAYPLSNKCSANKKVQHVFIKFSVKLAFRYSSVFYTTVRASELADTAVLKCGLFCVADHLRRG